MFRCDQVDRGTHVDCDENHQVQVQLRSDQVRSSTNVDGDEDQQVQVRSRSSEIGEDQQVQVRSGSSEIGGSAANLGGSDAPQQSTQHLRHYYVDVPNREDSNVDSNDQHVSIDPEFRAELDSRQEGNISDFLRLPELIPAKKRRKQQPFLDYTQSLILTSGDYIRGLQEVLAKKEAVVAVVKQEKKIRKRQRSKGNLKKNNNKGKKKEEQENEQKKKLKNKGSNRVDLEGVVEAGWNHRSCLSKVQVQHRTSFTNPLATYHRYQQRRNIFSKCHDLG